MVDRILYVFATSSYIQSRETLTDAFNTSNWTYKKYSHDGMSTVIVSINHQSPCINHQSLTIALTIRVRELTIKVSPVH